MRLYTIGHSTRSFDEFVEILQHYDIEQLIDVRSMPGSRRLPQFNAENLTVELPKQHIAYQHLAALGGRRRADKALMDNSGWRNLSFRGYADYMQTDEFISGLDQLIDLAKQKPTAIMCAEAVPWRCHRSLVGDALLVRGHEVIDIFDQQKAKAEILTSFARPNGLVLTYPSTD